MLLSSNDNTKQQHNHNDEFTAALLRDDRYAEAYELLKASPTDQTATHYNLALCHFWIENYPQALICLDRAQTLLSYGTSKLNSHTDGFYKAIRNKQNQLNEHRQAITQNHVKYITDAVSDAIIRLKTDCWLLLEEYGKVLETATPISHKNYFNIIEAINIAKTRSNHDERI